VNEVAKAIGMDSRIGSKISKGIGFWRLVSKRYLNLVYIAKSGLNEVADYWTNNYNERSSKKTFFEQTLYNTVSDKKSPFWDGLSKDTNDTRESAAFM
jgi:hypothetical protein